MSLLLSVSQLRGPILSQLRSSTSIFIRKMSSTEQFKQSPHKLLVIPGPIEVSDEVLFANAHPSVSHVSPDFIPVFGDCIRMMRTVVDTAEGQPFLIAGSGTLGWDQVASNLVEPGENALVLHSGYFGDSFADCLETYGANVDQLKAEIGAAVSQEAVADALKKKKYKLLTFTHVDTSTAVLSDAKAIVETVRRVSPETLVALDGVCSVASEEIHMDQWDVDVIIAASQKGLGTPPGLSILVASTRAIKVFNSRKSRPTSYYSSWKKWLPIMKAYESGKPSYFATPPVNLIYAFHASLLAITKSAPSLAERYELHREASRRIKTAAKDLGLKQLPLDPAFAATGMTALWYPDGLGAGDILPRLAKKGIIAAGGLHAETKDKYFRIGHMGITAVEKTRGDVDIVIKALKETLAEAAAEKTKQVYDNFGPSRNDGLMMKARL
ncbi:pyridoxal phosphate-dependent transferase [Lentinula aff. detonsa]|uniref:alanine--glyoxylate transaminase n=1 Tax=Lentinula aff. detonsa TaxID=2804958 RepID=A0AA38NL99_9AGAR|nr:pyridoxal phosphate-dependent transferase [Lentinula aff. detonsa]